MTKLEGLVGLGILGSTVVTGLTYGIAEAKGFIVPGKEYILPFFGVCGFCFGANPSSPADKLDPQVGAVCAGFTAALWGVSYGVGYLAERIIS